MPWKKNEHMDQRREFALNALGTLCQRASLAWIEPVVGVVGGAGDRFGWSSVSCGPISLRSWQNQTINKNGNSVTDVLTAPCAR
jgi:hypothetical protein